MNIVIKKDNTIVVRERELKMVKLLAEGLTGKQAAEKLKINQRTCEAAFLRLKDEFDCKTLPQLVAVFFRNKLID